MTNLIKFVRFSNPKLRQQWMMFVNKLENSFNVANYLPMVTLRLQIPLIVSLGINWLFTTTYWVIITKNGLVH